MLTHNGCILTRAEIMTVNRLYRAMDESDLWPILGWFNVTERAIKQLRKFRRNSEECYDKVQYAAQLDFFIGEIICNPKNWHNVSAPQPIHNKEHYKNVVPWAKSRVI